MLYVRTPFCFSANQVSIGFIDSCHASRDANRFGTAWLVRRRAQGPRTTGQDAPAAAERTRRRQRRRKNPPPPTPPQYVSREGSPGSQLRAKAYFYHVGPRYEWIPTPSGPSETRWRFVRDAKPHPPRPRTAGGGSAPGGGARNAVYPAYCVVGLPVQVLGARARSLSLSLARAERGCARAPCALCVRRARTAWHGVHVAASRWALGRVLAARATTPPAKAAPCQTCSRPTTCYPLRSAAAGARKHPVRQRKRRGGGCGRGGGGGLSHRAGGSAAPGGPGP